MENAIGLSQNVIDTSGSEGQDLVKQEIRQLKFDWDGLQQLSKEAHDSLNQCIASWNNFTSKFDKINKWIDEYSKKLRVENEKENKTPEDLVRCKVGLMLLLSRPLNVTNIVHDKFFNRHF